MPICIASPHWSGSIAGVTNDAGAQVAALEQQRKRCDIVGIVCLVIAGSGTIWWVIGYDQTWPFVLATVCLLVGGFAMLIRSRITKRIWALEPPGEPSYKRAWPDGT